MTNKSIKVLCCVDYFLPGFAGGGPIRTVANIQQLLAGTVELAIFTRDRDLGATTAFDGIAVDAWNQTDQGRVFYASPGIFGVSGLKRIIEQERFDLLYLNSFFSPLSSIRPYLWSRRTHVDLPILLAPRGEFSLGALALKSTKKSAFLTLARTIGLYKGIHWHASSAAEKADIQRQFPSATAIHIAEDPVMDAIDQQWLDTPRTGRDGTLSIVFISRISPMKNLDGLLQVLATLTCSAQLDIFGPCEDSNYWKICEELIEKLPPHVSAVYKGPLAPEDVSRTFAAYDLFAFPTLGENFGHVVFEALRVGTPVLLSDRTPWATQANGAITVIPLSDMAGWRAALHLTALRTGEQRREVREATRAFAADYARNSDTRRENQALFEAVALKNVTANPVTSTHAKKLTHEKSSDK